MQDQYIIQMLYLVGLKLQIAAQAESCVILNLPCWDMKDDDALLLRVVSVGLRFNLFLF